ncbi:MAG: 4Fe-4S binding protein [Bacteroidota bacterium]|nr:4Fe-4S binding protein [Bacteroidota bacterium]
MAKIKGSIVVDIEKCKGCGVCVTACPTNVIQLAEEVNGKGYHYAYMENPDACTGCANCAMVCPDSVITVYRKKIG